MKSTYKRIGDYIERRNKKNSENLYQRLLGINIDKYFMPSVANVIGTDLKKYKVVKPNQFSCNRMHVGRDYRLPIALSKEDEPFLVSPAYDVFEITRPDELLPEYFMMWCMRSEFDRNTWFYTDTDVRGKLGWDSFCDMTIPVPSPEKQQAIVDQYNTVNDRIKLNEQLNQKLEETAQAIYKHWFVDFEFPNENGKPYKSSGGKMVYNEELEKEIPVTWESMKVADFSKTMKSGGTPNRGTADYWNKRDFPWLKTGELKNQVIIDAEEYISELGLKESSAKMLPVNTVLVAMYGQGETKGQVGYTRTEVCTNQACCAMICENQKESSYLYYHLRVNRDEIVSIAIGGAQPNLSKDIIENIEILRPSDAVLENHPFISILSKRELLTRTNVQLEKVKSVLLSKMASNKN